MNVLSGHVHFQSTGQSLIFKIFQGRRKRIYGSLLRELISDRPFFPDTLSSAKVSAV